MSGCLRCGEVVACFYCGNVLSWRHEHDHFPVPARAGGVDVVAACVNCHDLKDRMGVDKWPQCVAFEAVWELCGAIGFRADAFPDEYESFAGLLAKVGENRELYLTFAWDGFSVAARLMFAKLVGMAADGPEYDRIRQRTKAALAEKRAAGVRLGRRSVLPASVVGRIVAERDAGAGWKRIADGLNADGVATGQGGARWYAASVRVVANGQDAALLRAGVSA